MPQFRVVFTYRPGDRDRRCSAFTAVQRGREPGRAAPERGREQRLMAAPAAAPAQGRSA